MCVGVCICISDHVWHLLIVFYSSAIITMTQSIVPEWRKTMDQN